MKRFVRDELPCAVLTEEHATRLRYRLLDPHVPAEANTVDNHNGGCDIEIQSTTTSRRRRTTTTTTASSSSIAHVFALLEGCKERLGIEDYQLGQTTLEEVFLRFAEEADAEEQSAGGRGAGSGGGGGGGGSGVQASK